MDGSLGREMGEIAGEESHMLACIFSGIEDS
jgi:hypothetical protein